MSMSEFVPIQLSNGAVIKVEVGETGREDVSIQDLSFDNITQAIEGVAESIQKSLAKVKPNKTTVKFGIEASIESGKLTAAIVKGASKANLEITLEWEHS